MYKRLGYRKNNQIAVVAVARELTGFVWALMQDCDNKAGGGLDVGARATMFGVTA